MSDFLYVRRYPNGNPLAGVSLMINRGHLESAVQQSRHFQLVREHGGLAVQLLPDAVATLERDGSLSIRAGRRADMSLLKLTLRELVELIPGAVIQDDDGRVL